MYTFLRKSLFLQIFFTDNFSIRTSKSLNILLFLILTRSITLRINSSYHSRNISRVVHLNLATVPVVVRRANKPSVKFSVVGCADGARPLIHHCVVRGAHRKVGGREGGGVCSEKRRREEGRRCTVERGWEYQKRTRVREGCVSTPGRDITN